MDGYVAPCVGAWIETDYYADCIAKLKQVAPCVGAWIETEITLTLLLLLNVSPLV